MTLFSSKWMIYDRYGTLTKSIERHRKQVAAASSSGALYDDPQIIIFDEATSSLDQKTEKEVMKEINNFSKFIRETTFFKTRILWPKSS